MSPSVVSDEKGMACETLWLCLEVQARLNPGKTAYRVLDHGLRIQASITFADLLRRADRRAAGLRVRGFAGQPVGILQQTSIDAIITFFAIVRDGGAVVLLNPRLSVNRGEGLRALIDDASCPLVICDAMTADRLQGSASIGAEVLTSELLDDADDNQPVSACAPGTVAVIQYTSGSTSAPKGVCITHRNLVANAGVLTRTFTADDTDVAVSWLPLFHDMGLMTGVVWPVTAGASAVLLRPSTFAARPGSWLSALSMYRGSISAAPNFAYQMCVDRVSRSEFESLDLSKWRVAICGAEPVDPRTVGEFLNAAAIGKFDPKCFYPSYGLAEATLFVSGGRHASPPRGMTVDPLSLGETGAVLLSAESTGRQIVSCGAPAANIEVSIVDPHRRTLLPDRMVGEIWIHGPSVGAGYLGRDDLNREVFQATRSDDDVPHVCLRTGDLGFMESGDLFVVGRLKDLIIVRGAKYAPNDIELTCRGAFEGLSSLSCVAFAVERGAGQEIVVLQEAPSLLEERASEIVQALRDAVARVHGIALDIVGILPPKSLPLTSSGKVRRGPTRDAWLAGALEMTSSWSARGRDSGAKERCVDA